MGSIDSRTYSGGEISEVSLPEVVVTGKYGKYRFQKFGVEWERYGKYPLQTLELSGEVNLWRLLWLN